MFSPIKATWEPVSRRQANSLSLSKQSITHFSAISRALRTWSDSFCFEKGLTLDFSCSILSSSDAIDWQINLWSLQWWRWHFDEQYLADLQDLHCCNFLTVPWQNEHLGLSEFGAPFSPDNGVRDRFPTDSNRRYAYYASCNRGQNDLHYHNDNNDYS